MDFLVELLLELLLQLTFEGFVAVADGSLRLSSRITQSIFKVILYIMCSFNVGALSVFFFPTPLMSSQPNPWISLLIVPFLVAISIVHFSRWLERTKSWNLELEKFSFSFIFAFGFAATRYLCMTYTQP